MADLLEEYGIVEDSRYRTCAKEAGLSTTLFVAGAVASIATIYAMTRGLEPTAYTYVFGLPAYVVLGIVIVDLVAIGAALVLLRFHFRELSLDPEDPARSAGAGSKDYRPE